LLVMRKDGPVSVIFPVQVTSMSLAAPFASHGLVKVPTPLEPAMQSRVGLGSTAVAVGGAIAEGAGVEGGAAEAVALALGAPEAPCFSPQPSSDATSAAARNALEGCVVVCALVLLVPMMIVLLNGCRSVDALNITMSRERFDWVHGHRPGP